AHVSGPLRGDHGAGRAEPAQLYDRRRPMSQSVRIRNTTRETMLADHGEVADNPWRRLKGLIGRRGFEPGEGLVLQDCRGIHTWFMGFPIDVLHVDRTGVVRRV